jgi:hypothetical protein
MKRVLEALPQMLVMTLVVATLFLLPVGGLLALGAWLLFGTTLESFVTFGGSIPAYMGLVAWWLVMVVPAMVWSAYMMPWLPND